MDKHEIALKCAEQLIRRNPPDLAHRAPELSRDLLYLENSSDLEVHRVRISACLLCRRWWCKSLLLLLLLLLTSSSSSVLLSSSSILWRCWWCW